jgi:hypothetical protein
VISKRMPAPRAVDAVAGGGCAQRGDHDLAGRLQTAPPVQQQVSRWRGGRTASQHHTMLVASWLCCPSSRSVRLLSMHAGTQQVQQLQGSMWCTSWVISCCVSHHADIGVWRYLALTWTYFCTHAGDGCENDVHPPAADHWQPSLWHCAHPACGSMRLCDYHAAQGICGKTRWPGVGMWRDWLGCVCASGVITELLYDHSEILPSHQGCCAARVCSSFTMLLRLDRGCYVALRWGGNRATSTGWRVLLGTLAQRRWRSFY